MLPLHAADTNHFKSSVLPIIEDVEDYHELFITLTNLSAPKVYYYTDCRINFNNSVASKKKNK